MELQVELIIVLLSDYVDIISFSPLLKIKKTPLIPEAAHSLSDSRRLVLENLTTHLKGSSSRSVMVLLVWSLNFVSS